MTGQPADLDGSNTIGAHYHFVHEGHPLECGACALLSMAGLAHQ